jgi:hypothetical protein
MLCDREGDLGLLHLRISVLSQEVVLIASRPDTTRHINHRRKGEANGQAHVGNYRS